MKLLQVVLYAFLSYVEFNYHVFISKFLEIPVKSSLYPMSMQ